MTNDMPKKERADRMKRIADYMSDNVQEDAIYLVVVVTPTGLGPDDVAFDTISNVPAEAQKIMHEKALENIDIRTKQNPNSNLAN